MKLRQTCAESVLSEFETGYVFSPYGAYGKAYLIARSTSSSVLSSLSIFCVSIWPVLGLIAITGIWSRVNHNYLPFSLGVMVGLIWMVCFALWSWWVTRALIEVPRNVE